MRDTGCLCIIGVTREIVRLDNMFEIIILGVSLLFGAYILYKIFPPRGVEQMTVDELKQYVRNDEIDYQFIDVRTVREFNELHIYGFKNIPLHDLKDARDQLEKDKKIVVICQTGIRGNEACKRLKRWGFKDVANVRGGVTTWEPH